MSLKRLAAIMQVISALYVLWIGFASPSTARRTMDFIVGGVILLAGYFYWRVITREPKQSKPTPSPDPPPPEKAGLLFADVRKFLSHHGPSTTEEIVISLTVNDAMVSGAEKALWQMKELRNINGRWHLPS